MAASTVPLYFLVKTVDEDKKGTVGIIFFVVVGVLMLPFMDWCAKHIFYFKGDGKPVAEEALRKELMSINLYDVPIMATEQGNTIEVTWNYLDEKWQGVMVSKGITEMFKVTLRFDPSRHLVTMLDTQGTINWGVHGRVASWSWFRGIYMNFAIVKSSTIRESYKGAYGENMFDTARIHNPVMNTILNRGWDVRFAMF